MLINQNYVKNDLKMQCTIDLKLCYAIVYRTKDIKLKLFQIKVFHRVLATDFVLKEMGIKESNRCQSCSNTKDNIEHMPWQCANVNQFWRNLKNKKI